jgi:hypothetical protein
MDHPLYSPGLALLRFLALSKLKNAPKWQRFSDIPDIQRCVTLLRSISESDFQDCIRQWNHRLTKYTASQVEYFEGDSSR